MTLSEWSKRMRRMIAFSPWNPTRGTPAACALGEQLDWPRLVAWLRERLPACGVPGLDVTREPEIAQFPGGHSNLTYLVRFGDVDIVVRRPPFGPLPPTAHDMAREFRWLSAMHRVFPARAAAVPAL